MAEREISYCTSDDGTTIAYAYNNTGREPPVAFATHSLIPVESQTVNHSSSTPLATVPPGIAEGRQSLFFDRRGIGYSQRDVSDISGSAQVADLSAVIAHVRLSGFDLVGLGDGCPVATTYAALHPDEVRRLALIYPLPLDDKTQGLSELIRANWALGRRALIDGSLGDLPLEDRRDRNRVLQRAVTSDIAAKYVELGYAWQPGSELASIVAPTLVVQAPNARGIFADRARSLAALIPGARLVISKGNPHDLVRRFLEPDESPRDEPTTPAAPSVAHRVATILFTDLVGHTEMMQRLGDDRGRDVLREHERITRDVLKANGGTEVKTMGDGFMASFGSVTKAVECAIALQRAFAARNAGTPPVGAQPSDPTSPSMQTSAQRPDSRPGDAARAAPSHAAPTPKTSPEPLHVRVGLNAGEPIEEDGDLFGATVILASRIAAKADGGEILVADTVRGLCSGKGFLFSDRGEFVAKGFEEPVRVYEVSWRNG